MRHKYATEAVVLARYPLGEASVLLALLTKEFGLVKARAQGLRKTGAKLAPALQTLGAATVTLVRGKDGWRLTGALSTESFWQALTRENRERAGRVASLMLRLLSGEHREPLAYQVLIELLRVLSSLTEEDADAAEIAAALYVLRLSGVDAGERIPDPDGRYGPAALSYVREHERELIVRINHGIEASGL